MSQVKFDANAQHTEAHHEPSAMDEKHNSENVTHVEAASVALASAVAASKPSLWSKSMLKLYFIMAVGYLVSTMNGFGKPTNSLAHLLC